MNISKICWLWRSTVWHLCCITGYMYVMIPPTAYSLQLWKLWTLSTKITKVHGRANTLKASPPLQPAQLTFSDNSPWYTLHVQVCLNKPDTFEPESGIETGRFSDDWPLLVNWNCADINSGPLQTGQFLTANLSGLLRHTCIWLKKRCGNITSRCV